MNQIFIIAVFVCVLGSEAHRMRLKSGQSRTIKTSAEIFNDNWLTCDACQLVTAIMSNGTRDHLEKEVLVGLVTTVIYDLLHIPQVDYNVSKGISETFVPEFMEIWASPIFKPSEFCYRLGVCTRPTNSPKPYKRISPDPVPADKRRPSTKPGPIVGKFLQINDVHLQIDYVAGANTQCGEPLCCRPSNGMGTNTSNSASPLGDYNCDTPLFHYRKLLEGAAKHGPFNFTVVAGDMASNEVWAQSEDYNRLGITIISQMLTQIMPKVPVFNTFGNHDAYPVNQRRGGSGDLWLNQFCADIWGEWLSQDAYTTLAAKGYYHTLITPGLRFISLNMDFGNSENFWQFLVDPGTDTNGQIQWFKTVLAQARAANEKVLVGAHIPLGEVDPAYGSQIENLLVENVDIVMGVVHGHTHDDEFQVCQNKLLALVNPCGTTMGGTNTGFRIIYYDADFNIVDYEQYAADLGVGIRTGSLDFTKSYRALEFYNLTDMSAASWRNLVDRFKTDDALFQKWYYMYTTRMGGTCDAACKQAALCAMVQCSSPTCQL